jgi:DNA polymerase-1
MKTIVFDIECNGLLRCCTTLWVLAAKDLDTGEMRHWSVGDTGWMEALDSADILAGHNIIQFDLAVLFKLYGWTPRPGILTQDTLIMSQWLNYRRFGMEGHSLKRWGEFLGFQKIEFDDWYNYSQEMVEYCRNDVELTTRILLCLRSEFAALAKRHPIARVALRAEHEAAHWVGEANVKGWPFNEAAAEDLYQAVSMRYQEIQARLEPRLGLKTIAVDKAGGVVEAKEPKVTKKGTYYAHVANWFGVPDYSALFGDGAPVAGPYCRVVFEPRKLSSVTDVKNWLYTVGWVPTEWNTTYNPQTRENEKTSPKITEDSLGFLGEDGKLYSEYLMLGARKGILRGWLRSCYTGLGGIRRVYGECRVIGTPSMRATHSVIVNVPTVDSDYGEEMRALFEVPSGWVQIGADSAGNQLRGLCHYLNNKEYTEIVISGDVHEYHRGIVNGIITEILKKPPSCTRGDAKRLIYALLFGCGDAKTAIYTLHCHDEPGGGVIKKNFLKRVAGFDKLVESLSQEYKRNKRLAYGYIRGIGGNPIFVDAANTLLCYLLQSCEKASTSCAIMWLRKKLVERGIPYQPLIYMHDEVQFAVPEEYAEEAKLLGAEAFREGPKALDIHIMDGAAKTGHNWRDCH